MILQVNNISFSYPSHPVLHDVGFSVAEHDMLAILGPNGSGKTTLLRCLNGILSSSTGTIFLEDHDVHKMGMRERSRLMGYVPQRGDPTRLTVYDMILLGRKPHLQTIVRQEDHEIVTTTMHTLGIEHLAMHYTDAISGGEFQMVQIARALAQRPRLILLDEPTNNLDIRNQLNIMTALSQIVGTTTMGAILSIHDINLAIRYANRFMMMTDGVIVAAGSEKIITSTHIKRVYGIDARVVNIDGVPCVIPR